MANRHVHGGTRPAANETRKLSSTPDTRGSGHRQSFDEILAFLSGSLENRRARQVWEWERMRRQSARSE